MTPATSVSFYTPAFNDFLFAPVDAGLNGNSLSLLSALARLDVDPWTEAAELAALPKGRARRRLAELLERLPNRPWARTEAGQIADRLLELLPQKTRSDVAKLRTVVGDACTTFTPQPKVVMAIYVALALFAVIVGGYHASNSRSGQANVSTQEPSQPATPQAPLKY